MMRKIFIVLFLLGSFHSLGYTQTKTYTTTKLEKSSIKIDGNFDDIEWTTISWEGDFIQYEPNEGERPTQSTEFKILYDNNNLYIAIKAYDTEPTKIEKRMSRRDSWDGDLVAIQLDSYFDKKTAFVFAVSASGVRSDAVTTNDDVNNDDSTWDPLWEVKTSITENGWNAEMRIPLSQLRFDNKVHKTWGLEVVRYFFRNKEWNMWQYIPQKSSGWVSRFGKLHGISNIKPKRQVEISPYFSSKFKFYEKEDGNPYADGTDLTLNAGIDGKIGITNNLTLDFAINPDFGQVEADPSEVNLTAFETFFSEKRPFFVEGSNITDYQITPGGSPWGRDNLFYSRRLGSSPHYYPNIANNEYIKMPDNSRILGALKLTGKTKSGLSIGIIESLTNKEFAKIDSNGDERKEEVEPFTNFFAARLQKDMNDGNTIFGGMFTSTYRFIDNPNLDFLNTSALTGGLDFKQFFKDKKYYFSANLVASKIDGNEIAISEQQLSSRRYYQRPDADYFEYDSTRTSLSGNGGNLTFGKQSNKGLRYTANLTWRSPGLELNDIGYLRRANNIFQYIWVGYKITKPFSIFREASINTNEWSGWDYGGTSTFFGGNISSWFQFKNFWSINISATTERENIDNAILRGGPAMKTPGSFNYSIGLGSNSTKKITLQLYFNDNYGKENSSRKYSLFAFITYRPLDILSISISPNYNYNNSELQYISTESFESDPRYIFGNIEQKTLSMTMRIDLNITPDFTIQYYGSPFISSGLYSDYKKITSPIDDTYENRFHIFNNNEINYLLNSEMFEIDENINGTPDYYFSNPNFNYKQFRSNLVLRWEYKPGSLLYLVWSQDKTGYSSDGNFDFTENIKDLFKISSNNIFLIKLSYRFINL